MKKILITATLVIWLGGILFAQTKPTNVGTIADMNKIGRIIVKNYHPEPDSTKETCWEGCIFIKFRINSEHQFVNVSYTASTPLFIKNALDQTFRGLNKNLVLKNLSTDEKKVYIQPVQINNNNGCGIPSGFDLDSKQQALLDKKAEIFKERQSAFNHSAESIWNITNFTDGRFDLINVTLLSPIRTGGVMN